jgi:hypothetical protein
VWDATSTSPVLGEAGIDDEGGRGLAIVAALSQFLLLAGVARDAGDDARTRTREPRKY